MSSIIVGITLRFYKGDDNSIIKNNAYDKRRKNIFAYAIDELVEARKKDGRSTGELIGDSIKESVSTLLLVGGFIILFSVLTRMFMVTGIIAIISRFLINILHPLGFTEAMVLPLVGGFFEITNGTNLASQAAAPLLHQVIIANAVIAWSGMSVHAQVATMVNGTDIK
ncbi:MAG: sporulation integral membrane protein YlbJ, partial [Spirochaetia bacterium]